MGHTSPIPCFNSQEICLWNQCPSPCKKRRLYLATLCFFVVLRTSGWPMSEFLGRLSLSLSLSLLLLLLLLLLWCLHQGTQSTAGALLGFRHEFWLPDPWWQRDNGEYKLASWVWSYTPPKLLDIRNDGIWKGISPFKYGYFGFQVGRSTTNHWSWYPGKNHPGRWISTLRNKIDVYKVGLEPIVINGVISFHL